MKANGNMSRRTFLRQVGTVVLLAPLATRASRLFAQSAPATLDGFFADLRSMRGFSASFEEEKRVALLRAPLVSRGEMHFRKPSSLVRRVTAPAPSQSLLENGRVVLVSGHERQVIDVAQNPVAHAFVSSFSNILSGDRAALQRHYAIEFAPSGQAWRVTLTPRPQSPVARFLTRLELQGTGRIVSEMRMLEASGDSTVTRFSRVQVDRQFSANEVQRIFVAPFRER